jgi:5-(hydroxymethyl)furfural/furfural oxidase
MRAVETGGSIDALIVGGGSAGAVLAARLSEDAGRNVMLIEAGPDLPPGVLPPAIASPYVGLAYVDPRRTQPYFGVLTAGAASNDPLARPAITYQQGHGLGGGSAINGLGANRGSPSDYDEWRDMGASGWGWDDVLPWFIKLERDLDFGGPLHGRDGPFPIRDAPAEWRTGFTRAALATLAKRGVPEREDQNGVWEDGVYAQRLALDEGLRRAPTGTAYLTADVRRRPNLSIMTDVSVMRVTMDGRKATGVTVDLGLARQNIPARHVILAAGAFGSPTLLMRSGIGPGADLQSRGIAVARSLAGVGGNLMDHPYAGISAFLPRASRTRGEGQHHIPALWRFSSGLEGCPAGDMHMGFISRVAWHAMGRRIGALAFWVNKSFSRGRLRLGLWPDNPPDIDLRLLSDERDRIRLRAAFREAAAIAAEMAATGAVGPPQPARLSDRARRYGAPTVRNRLLMGAAAALVDASGPFAARVAGRMSYSGPPLAELLSDDGALDDYLDESVTGVWHPSGTCRMGRADDALAVADSGGRVHGVENLSVCDASIFPTIPCANLNVPVIMAAEKIAAGFWARALT